MITERRAGPKNPSSGRPNPPTRAPKIEVARERDLGSTVGN